MLFDLYKDEADMVLVPCKGLMEFVEQGVLDGPELDKYYDEVIKPLVTDDVESIVLGCTHYPFLRPYFNRKLAGKDITLIDGSLGTAVELKRRLKENDLLKDDEGKEVKGKVEILNSVDSPEMIERSWQLLNQPL